jgi:hypothetical protein
MTLRTRLYFNGDECSGIHCGLRVVDLKLGPKWVRIKSPSTARWSRMRRSLFEVHFGNVAKKAR